MKKAIFITLVLMGISVVRTQAMTPRAVYWVVETNKAAGSFSIVRFYNDAHAVVHEVRIDGITIDVTNKRQRNKLNQVSKRFSSSGNIDVRADSTRINRMLRGRNL